MSLVIREFCAEDLESVLHLFYRVVHSVGSKYHSENELNAWAPVVRHDQQQWQEELLSNVCYVVENAGHIIAFGDMTLNGYVERLYVDPKWQGRGPALLIFGKFKEHAQRRGLKEMRFEASPMLMRLANLRGAELIEERKKERRGEIFTTYLMRFSLTRQTVPRRVPSAFRRV